MRSMNNKKEMLVEERVHSEMQYSIEHQSLVSNNQKLASENEELRLRLYEMDG